MENFSAWELLISKLSEVSAVKKTAQTLLTITPSAFHSVPDQNFQEMLIQAEMI